MKTSLLHKAKGYTFLSGLLFLVQMGSAQYVDLTAEIEFYSWSTATPTKTQTIRCVVGTNTWQMEGDFCRNCKATYWFNGREIIVHSVVDRALSPQVLSEPNKDDPPLGTESTQVYDTNDGSPSRPRSAIGPDRMTLQGRIAWLAFCSGPYLKHEGRELFPPDGFWKERIYGDHFLDQTVVFSDPFGLPKSVDLYSTNNQPVVQYRVTASTNVLGWVFPTEFYLAQYCPAPLPGQAGITTGANGWQLQYTAKGKVTGIRPGIEPQIPPEVLKAAGK